MIATDASWVVASARRQRSSSAPGGRAPLEQRPFPAAPPQNGRAAPVAYSISINIIATLDASTISAAAVSIIIQHSRQTRPAPSGRRPAPRLSR